MSWFLDHARVGARPHEKITSEDLLGFFQQLNTLLDGGASLLEALKLGSSQSESLRLRTVIRQVADQVEKGATFNAALTRHPSVFNPYWVQLVRAGEASGMLSIIIQRLASFLESSQRLRGKVVSALTYPAILVFMAALTLFVMMWKVIPTFTAFFKDMGGQLPGITVMVIQVSDIFARYGLWILLGVITLPFGLRWLFKDPGRKLGLDTVLLTVPMIGDAIVYGAMQKLASNLNLLLKSGIPLLEALEILQTLYENNQVYKRALKVVWLDVSMGKDLSSSLNRTRVFTPLLTSMVRIGEESGDLSPVLVSMDQFYARRLETMVTRVTSMMEPVIIIVMGGIIGTILGAIYIPMFNMSGAGKGG